MAKTQLVPDPATIKEFLEQVLAREWYHLYSSNPRIDAKSGHMRGYAAESADAAIQWIEDEQRKSCNIYYALNAPREKQSKKATKKELRWLYGAHVDIDLPSTIDRNSDEAEDWIDAAIDRVDACAAIGGGPPSIVMSGNGIQALWMFGKPLRAAPENLDAVEHINRQLIQLFRAPPGTADPTRVLRVPGTINFPNSTKTAKGCHPVSAELIRVGREAFTLAAFAGLPVLAKNVIANRSSASHVDYTRLNYQDWEPWTYAELRRDTPDIEVRVARSLAENGDDRSVAAWGFIHAAYDFVTRQQKMSAVELLGDRDVMKNISHLLLDSGIEPLIARYEDTGYGTLGHDVATAMHSAADTVVAHTPRREARTITAERRATAMATPLNKVAPQEARKIFINYVRSCMISLADLPNALFGGKGEPGSRQLATESNIREILTASKCTLRWDVMRDQMQFRIAPEAVFIGDDGREEHSPREMFETALRDTYADLRGAAEISLWCDCIAQFGITNRHDLPGLMDIAAKDNRFHPLEDYATSRVWDGVSRMASVANCLTSTHPLKERYLRLFFRQCVAAVKSLDAYRTVGNGLQLTGIVTLVGPQGIGKSTFWSAVTPPGMASKGTSLRLGSHGEADSKRECLSGLVCNLNEVMATLGRSEANAFKDFTSGTFDEYRVAFAKQPISKPRMTIFCATANDLRLYDRTGSRRQWALPVDVIDLEALRRVDLQQVYAEAWAEVMGEGAQWWLTPAEDAVRARENGKYECLSDAQDEAGDVLSGYLNGLTAMHTPCWLTGTQICAAMGQYFRPKKWHAWRDALLAAGIEYRSEVTVQGVRMQRVYEFPVLPEVRARARAGSL